MVDEELLAALEKIEQRDLTLWPFEGVSLGDLDHGELATFGCESVTGAHGSFLFGEEFLAGYKPFGWAHDLL